MENVKICLKRGWFIQFWKVLYIFSKNSTHGGKYMSQCVLIGALGKFAHYILSFKHFAFVFRK